MADRLGLYNGALQLMGERRLASLTEARKPRRELDTAYDNGAVSYCLEQGYWNFATRTVQATYDPDVTPNFGFERAYNKPTDWVRTSALCSDDRFIDTLNDRGYVDENGYWWCDLDTLYVRYISDDAQYGGDLSLWPETFTKFVEAYLAQQTVIAITQSNVSGVNSIAQSVDERFKKRLKDAKNKDAMNQGEQTFTPGTWTRARTGGRINRDRLGGSLIG